MPAGGAHADSIQGKPLSGETKNLRNERRHWSRNDVRYRRAKRMLDDLIPEGINTIARLMHSDDDRVALLAAQDILNRAGLRAPSEQRLSVDLQAKADEHIQALLALAQQGSRNTKSIEAKVIDAVAINVSEHQDTVVGQDHIVD